MILVLAMKVQAEVPRLGWCWHNESKSQDIGSGNFVREFQVQSFGYRKIKSLVGANEVTRIALGDESWAQKTHTLDT